MTTVSQPVPTRRRPPWTLCAIGLVATGAVAWGVTLLDDGSPTQTTADETRSVTSTLASADLTVAEEVAPIQRNAPATTAPLSVAWEVTLVQRSTLRVSTVPFDACAVATPC